MPLPSFLEDYASQQFSHLLEQQPVIAQWNSDLQAQLKTVIGLSKFVHETLMRDEALCRALPEILSEDSRSESYREHLFAQLSVCEDETNGLRILRQFRNQEMVYIAWRDFLNTWTLNESLEHLSQLAEALIFETYQWQYKACCHFR